MDSDAEAAIEQVTQELQTLNDNVESLAQILDTISDGLFYLNLHLGAEVAPWTRGR